MIPASLLRLADQVLALRSPGDPLRASLEALLGATTWGTGFSWQTAALLLTLAALVLAARHGTGGTPRVAVVRARRRRCRGALRDTGVAGARNRHRGADGAGGRH